MKNHVGRIVFFYLAGTPIAGFLLLFGGIVLNGGFDTDEGFDLKLLLGVPVFVVMAALLALILALLAPAAAALAYAAPARGSAWPIRLAAATTAGGAAAYLSYLVDPLGGRHPGQFLVDGPAAWHIVAVWAAASAACAALWPWASSDRSDV